MAELIQNGQLEIITVTADLYDDVIKFHRENFLKYESLSLAGGIMQHEEAITEAATRLRAQLEQGLSFAVRQIGTNNLAAICVNKFVPYFAAAAYQSDCLKRLDAALACLEIAFDIIKAWNIDCAMEISFLSTHPDFAGYGLATILAKHAVEFARQLLRGTLNVGKVSVPAHIRHMKPKAVFSVFTSKYTQKIGEKLGMQTMFKVSYKNLFHECESFVSKIDAVHEYLTIAALRL